MTKERSVIFGIFCMCVGALSICLVHIWFDEEKEHQPKIELLKAEIIKGISTDKILKDLTYIESRGVEILWSKDIFAYDKEFIYAEDFTYSCHYFPTELTIYTNVNIETQYNRIESVMNQIRKNDNYMKSLEDNETTIELKVKFQHKIK